MPLLLDGNVSRYLKKSLRDYYDGEIISIFDLHFDEVEDIDIWKYAKENGFDILTKDSDFLDIAARFGAPPKVVFLQIGNGPTSEIVGLFQRHQANLKTELANEETAIIFLGK